MVTSVNAQAVVSLATRLNLYFYSQVTGKETWQSLGQKADSRSTFSMHGLLVLSTCKAFVGLLLTNLIQQSQFMCMIGASVMPNNQCNIHILHQ
jgi:hypothetical protein